MPVIQTSVDLTPFNTLGLPARASHFIRLTSGAEIAALRGQCVAQITARGERGVAGHRRIIPQFHKASNQNRSCYRSASAHSFLVA